MPEVRKYLGGIVGKMIETPEERAHAIAVLQGEIARKYEAEKVIIPEIIPGNELDRNLRRYFFECRKRLIGERIGMETSDLRSTLTLFGRPLWDIV
jgi:hypothetical protein